MDLKRCFKCGTDKPRTEFYRHPQMGDGLLGKCRLCTRLDVKRDRLAKLETKRAYDKQRADLPHRVTLRTRIAKEWAQRHPGRRKAQHTAGNAVRDGRMTKATSCEGCGREDRPVEMHHPDYDRPLLVVWLCKPCHAIADKIRRRTEVA